MKYLKQYRQFAIFEAAKSVGDLNKDDNICLSVIESSNKVEFILYDWSQLKEKQIIGAVRIVEDDKSGTPNPYGSYSVNMSAVNKEFYQGYGPALYDIVLQYCGVRGLRPDRSVSSEAKRVWKFYFDNRKDISKKPIDNFRSPLTDTTLDDGKLSSPFSKTDPNKYPETIEDSSFMNQVYYYGGEKQYKNLVNNHKIQISKIGSEFEDCLIKKMNDLFVLSIN